MPQLSSIEYPDSLPNSTENVVGAQSFYYQILAQALLDELRAGSVAGSGNGDSVVPVTIDEHAELESIPPIRKRLVKIVNGKIVASRIAYMKLAVIDAAYGYGYIFGTYDLAPEGGNQGGNVVFCPALITLE